MDDNVKEVLRKVELLCEQNPEFAAALRNKLGVTVASSPVPVQDERVEKIANYLGLDYKLDTISPSETMYHELDYSFIKDSAVRDTLVSDFREMMRYRYGTRTHKADFMEFCKYAHFQLEGLINYFMETWSLDDDDKPDMAIAKANIEENWPENLGKPKFKDDVKTIEDIDYFQKVTAILNFLEISQKLISRYQHETIYAPEKIHVVFYLSEVIGYIRRTRNELSHRGKAKTKNIDALIEQYESQKRTTKDALGNLAYQFSTQNDKNIKYYMWFNYTPWDDVIKAVCMLEESAREVFKQE